MMYLFIFILKEYLLFLDFICFFMMYDVIRVIKKWMFVNIWFVCFFIVMKKRKYWLIKVKIKKKDVDFVFV